MNRMNFFNNNYRYNNDSCNDNQTDSCCDEKTIVPTMQYAHQDLEARKARQVLKDRKVRQERQEHKVLKVRQVFEVRQERQEHEARKAR